MSVARCLAALVLVCGVSLAERADACTCAARPEADAVTLSDVVAIGVVGAPRAEPDGSLSAVVTVDAALRGPAERTLRVSWRKPDGRSCDLVHLKPGRWVLFAQWGADGALWIGRCDAHSRALGKVDVATRRTELMKHMKPVRTEAEAISAAARAAGGRLVASMAGKPGTELLSPPPRPEDLVRPELATVIAQKDGSWIVRWFRNPPAGTAIDAEVHVKPDGVTHVVRADASFSPD